mgnify:CR=1 FL=1
MTTGKTDFSKLKVGNALSETQFYKVNKIVGEKVELKPESGEPITVNKKYVEAFLSNADQWDSEVKLSRTELIEKFKSSVNTVLKVNYNKKVDADEVLKEILETHKNTAPSQVEKAFKLTIKKTLEGIERTLEGRYLGTSDDFGRFNVIDMQAPAGRSPLRLVDPRTLNWLIVGNVKYIVK